MVLIRIQIPLFIWIRTGTRLRIQILLSFNGTVSSESHTNFQFIPELVPLSIIDVYPAPHGSASSMRIRIHKRSKIVENENEKIKILKP